MYSLDESLEELAFIQEGAQLCACNDVRKSEKENKFSSLSARNDVQKP